MKAKSRIKQRGATKAIKHYGKALEMLGGGDKPTNQVSKKDKLVYSKVYSSNRFDKYWKNSFLKQANDINGEDYDSLKQFIASEKELSRQEGMEEGYFQGVKMLEWRINCDTLISELSGWKGCVDMAVDESLDTYKNNTEQREYLTKTRTKRQY